jgi:hypothetical protein
VLGSNESADKQGFPSDWPGRAGGGRLDGNSWEVHQGKVIFLDVGDGTVLGGGGGPFAALCDKDAVLLISAVDEGGDVRACETQF